MINPKWVIKKLPQTRSTVALLYMGLVLISSECLLNRGFGETLIGTLISLSILALIVGIYSPQAVLPKFVPRNRGIVILFYLGLSIIIPSYNEADNIENTTTTVLKIMDEAHIPCEVVFVSDGSTDDTFAKILDFSRIDNRVKGIEFSRNFGKEAAIIAGLEKGSGDCFVVMDCDLQHPPETIVKMYNLWKDGYDIIEGIKKERGK